MDSRNRLFRSARLTLTVLPFLLTIPALANEPVIPEGDSTRGATVFETLKCFRCHTVEGVELPDFDLPASLKIHLGDATYLSWDRDAYARAIMNPEHIVTPQYQAIVIQAGDPKAGEESPMPNFNASLSVADLVDLATFLAAAKK